MKIIIIVKNKKIITGLHRALTAHAREAELSSLLLKLLHKEEFEEELHYS